MLQPSWIMPTATQATNADMSAQWDPMISVAAVAGPVKAAVVVANAVVAATGGDETVADAGVATYAEHMRITSISPTLTGISLPMNGSV